MKDALIKCKRLHYWPARLYHVREPSSLAITPPPPPPSPFPRVPRTGYSFRCLLSSSLLLDFPLVPSTLPTLHKDFCSSPQNYFVLSPFLSYSIRHRTKFLGEVILFLSHPSLPRSPSVLPLPTLSASPAPPPPPQNRSPSPSPYQARLTRITKSVETGQR